MYTDAKGTSVGIKNNLPSSFEFSTRINSTVGNSQLFVVFTTPADQPLKFPFYQDVRVVTEKGVIKRLLTRKNSRENLITPLPDNTTTLWIKAQKKQTALTLAYSLDNTTWTALKNSQGTDFVLNDLPVTISMYANPFYYSGKVDTNPFSVSLDSLVLKPSY